MRMKLHRNTIGGDYELYTIYELSKFADIKQLSGYSSIISNDNVSPNANKFRKWRCVNNLLRNYTPKMPIRCTESGSILQADLRYNTLDNGYYTYPAETWQDIEMIQTGVRPDDWASNPNYIQIYQFSRGFNNSPQGGYNNVNVKIAVCVNSQNTSFETTGNYALDSKGKFLKRFTTDTGYTFSCCSSAYWNYDRWAGILRESAGFTAYGINSNTQYQYLKHLFTRPDNTIIDYTYRSETDYGITGIPSGPDYNWDLWGNAKNVVSVFVHFADNGVDYYGIAQVQYDTHLDTAIPIAIEVVAFDSEWWGTSIVSGGEEGQGNWGNPVVISGGDGTFDSTSDDYGDSDGVTVTTAVSHINQTTGSGIGDLFNGNGAVNLYMLRTYDRTTNMVANVYKALFSKNFIDAWKVNTLSPMSAVLSTHFIPHEFVSQTFGNSEIVVGGYNLSDWIVEHTTLTSALVPLAKPVGEIFLGKFDFGKYFGAFPDFAPYTQIFLHIPFVGKVEINVNAVQHGVLSVSMTCDIASGNVCAWIHCTDRERKKEYVHTATGNCAYSFPLFALNQDGSGVGRLISGSMSTMASLGTLLGGIATGNAAIAITGGIGLATSMPNTVNAAMDTLHPKSNVEISGVLGGNNSMIAPTTCWIEIIRPEWVQNKYYQKLHGIPSQLSNTIADSGSGLPFSGYLEIESIDLDGVDCTDSERSEIERLLKSGVYIRGEEI